MTTPAEARRIEQRSLRFGVGANAVMALAGFSAHVLTGSSALLLDGLYSAVLVGSSLIASRISRNVVRPPDRAWPYGYEGQEALYVLFRSLVLLGVIGFGVGSSCSTLIDWWRGNSIAPLHLEPVALYTALMTALCGLLAWRHRRDWRRTGRVSLLLLTEARNARIDAVITLATGLALLASPLLLVTPLSALAPITDALLVLAVSLKLSPLPTVGSSFARGAQQMADARKMLREMAEVYDPEIPNHKNPAFVTRAREVFARQQDELSGGGRVLGAMNDRRWSPPTPCSAAHRSRRGTEVRHRRPAACGTRSRRPRSTIRARQKTRSS